MYRIFGNRAGFGNFHDGYFTGMGVCGLMRRQRIGTAGKQRKTIIHL